MSKRRAKFPAGSRVRVLPDSEAGTPGAEGAVQPDSSGFITVQFDDGTEDLFYEQELEAVELDERAAFQRKLNEAVELTQRLLAELNEAPGQLANLRSIVASLGHEAEHAERTAAEFERIAREGFAAALTLAWVERALAEARLDDAAELLDKYFSGTEEGGS